MKLCYCGNESNETKLYRVKVVKENEVIYLTCIHGIVITDKTNLYSEQELKEVEVLK